MNALTRRRSMAAVARAATPIANKTTLAERASDRPAVSAGDLSLPPPAEGSAAVAARVAAAREIQIARYAGLPAGQRPAANAEADGRLLEEVAGPDPEGRRLLTEAAARLKLSARGYHRVLRVARTLADLEGAASVRRPHIAEALAYRRIAPGR